MAKVNKEQQARLDGMIYALKIAQEKGIEELKREIEWRGRSNAPIPLRKDQIDEFCMKVKLNTVDTFSILSLATLRDEFGFGKKRAQQFLNRFYEKADCIDAGYATWDDYREILREEMDIDLEIRENNNDVV